MNEHLELEKLGLGSKNSQPIPSKSLLTTININREVPKVEDLPLIIINKPKEVVQPKPLVINQPIEVYPKKDMIFYAAEYITIETGFIQNKSSIIPCDKELKCDPHKNEDSVIDSVDTGFGCDNTVVKDCPKPKYKTHLCKENYLNEFKTESEKQLARTNLGVYSKEEIDSIIARIVENNNKEFVTKGEVESMISNLDFVNSTLRSHADYEIPSDLFKL